MNIGKVYLKQQDFNILWSSIENELYKLFHNTRCSALVVYNNVYIICTDPDSKFIESLYWKIGDFIYERARELRNEIYKEEDWIVIYNLKFNLFKKYIKILSEMCDFIKSILSSKVP
ncbi:cullin-like protein [Nosema bombycis CQ1]|uniref:Cullin-like protein n=1 Tax=Nosema bombycis (strain CQ1 / CVCC 102059) TaxID=578461 RepID=R0MIY9_NOSB1|nr:cullin-like protein [Nosema bombycis CQ1]|eukprot:EOB14175.1 cullin-like protein [Nosema bombycis CQ1]